MRNTRRACLMGGTRRSCPIGEISWRSCPMEGSTSRSCLMAGSTRRSCPTRVTLRGCPSVGTRRSCPTRGSWRGCPTGGDTQELLGGGCHEELPAVGDPGGEPEGLSGAGDPEELPGGGDPVRNPAGPPEGESPVELPAQAVCSTAPPTWPLQAPPAPPQPPPPPPSDAIDFASPNPSWRSAASFGTSLASSLVSGLASDASAAGKLTLQLCHLVLRQLVPYIKLGCGQGMSMAFSLISREGACLSAVHRVHLGQGLACNASAALACPF